MARKNHRFVEDATFPSVSEIEASRIPAQRVRWMTDREWDELQSISAERKRRRTAERKRARVAEAIDWGGSCCVPGCEEPTRMGMFNRLDWAERDPDNALPLCLHHLTTIWEQAERDLDKSLIWTMLAGLQAHRDERDKQERDVRQKEFLATTSGHIYFVQQNDLIKVGWTRNLRQRLRGYGAGVEVLAYYPAERSDETNLHRQLRPYLVRGREWYEDTRLIRDLVAKVVEQHGPPKIDLRWTEPKEVVKLRKR